MRQILIRAAVAATIVTGATAQEVTLGRFFGACEDAGTNTKTSVGEACIIQSIINAASAEIDGVTVKTLPTGWESFYDQLKTSYAGGTPPDIHVLHRHRIPEFAGLGALADLSDDLEDAGIDISDWAPAALDAVSYKGGIYGVPLDFHANLWHVNLDILDAAGLVSGGKPVLPSSPKELLAHAKRVKDATGHDYLAAAFAQSSIGVRFMLALVWQQNANIFTDDGTATINSDAAAKAVTAITQLFDAGYANPQLNYSDSQQAFLNGETAILVNGTWVVDFYTAEAAKPEVGLNDYYVADFPTLFEIGATWADTHMWVVPASLKSDKSKYAAALKVLAFINDHNIDWARTGHMAIRTSVLESAEYANLPHRSEYAATATLAKDTPPSERYGAIQDVLNREIQAIWLTGKAVDTALADAEAEIQDILDR